MGLYQFGTKSRPSYISYSIASSRKQLPGGISIKPDRSHSVSFCPPPSMMRLFKGWQPSTRVGFSHRNSSNVSKIDMSHCVVERVPRPLLTHSQSGRKRQMWSWTPCASLLLPSSVVGKGTPRGLQMTRRIAAMIIAVRFAPCLPDSQVYGGGN